MALVPEDGTGSNPAADTYATVAELRAYAEKRGATVPAAGTEGDAACEVLLTKAMDYLQTQSERYKGCIVLLGQPLAWPRVDVYVDGHYLPSNTIPSDIKKAQMQLAIDAQTIELLPTVNAAGQKGPVVRQKVDVLEVEYAAPAVNRKTTWFAKAEGLLARYYARGANQARVVRT